MEASRRFIIFLRIKGEGGFDKSYSLLLEISSDCG
jgi:hypothetical protein